MSELPKSNQFAKYARWAYVCEKCGHHVADMTLPAGVVPDGSPPLCPRCVPYAQTRLTWLGDTDDQRVGPA